MSESDKQVIESGDLMEWHRDRIKAVLFDLDNTLLDRTRTFRAFAEQFIGEYFPAATEEEQRTMLWSIIKKDEDGYKDKGELFHELIQELAWVRKPAHKELMDYYKERYVANAVLMEDAIELLAYCRSKYKLALITNGRTKIQYGKIDQLSLRDYFDTILVSEEVGIKKPDRRIFEQALESLMITPEEGVYIGDHPKNDMGGADRAGLHTVWVKVNQPWPENLDVKPVKIVTDLKSLKKWL